jgi:peptide/nickel transport system permease protein
MLHDTLAQAAVVPPRSAARWGLLRAVWAKPTGRAGLLLVLLILVAAAGAPLLAPYDPLAIDGRSRLLGSSFEHLLGTDQLGRDVASRVLYGSRTAMSIAFVGLGGATVLGLLLGLLAGYGPRWLDAALMLAFDSVASLPVFIFALALVTLLQPSLTTILVIVVAFTTPVYARVARSQTLVLKSTEFITATRGLGAGLPRVLLRHLLPNMLGPFAVLIAMDVPTVITIESGLSFLGLGIRPPAPSWGSILNDGFSFIRQAPQLVVAAGLPILVATVGFTFLGEAVRDYFDPRTRTRR